MFDLATLGVDMGKTPTQIGAQIRSLMQAKGVTVNEVSEGAEIHRSRISGFLTGANGLSGVNLVSVLKQLGIDLEKLLQQELAETLNPEMDTKSLGSDLEIVLDALSPMEQKTLLSTIIRKANTNYAEGIDDVLHRVEDYKDKITFKRRGAC